MSSAPERRHGPDWETSIPGSTSLRSQPHGVFHDVTAGNNIVPCKTGTPDCTTGRYGYNAGPGYDHVTGLGSIDAAKLLENWSAAKSNPKGSSVVTAMIDPSPVYQQAPDDDGFAWFYTIRLSETGGVASKLTALLNRRLRFERVYCRLVWNHDSLRQQLALAQGTRERYGRALGHAVCVRRYRQLRTAMVKENLGVVPGPETGKQKGAAMSLTSDPAVVVKIGRRRPELRAGPPIRTNVEPEGTQRCRGEADEVRRRRVGLYRSDRELVRLDDAARIGNAARQALLATDHRTGNTCL